MSRIIVFAGTTEGRNFSEWLCERRLSHALCVATEYGQQVLTSSPYAEVFRGRMTEAEMVTFFQAQQAEIVVDATHPYAALVTENIRRAAQSLGLTYLRLLRDGMKDSLATEEEKYKVFADTKACADYLRTTEGTIFLTTGSKELSVFMEEEPLRNRLIARVLPGKESIGICENLGLPGKQIVAMQGPFSKEMNEALLKNYQAKILVTKASGKTGGFFEKLAAAEALGIEVCIIGRPAEENGYTSWEVCEKVRTLMKDSFNDSMDASGENPGAKSQESREEKPSLDISLIGCGMGHPENLTIEAAKALEKADLVFGASRLLRDMDILKESYPWYLAKDILPFLEEEMKKRSGNLHAAILFSGDSGFYSGAKKMNLAIEDLAAKAQGSVKVKIYPGVSSISNLAACLGESWEDAKILSLHGKGTEESWGKTFLSTVKAEKKTFLILSGVKNLQAIGRLLSDLPGITIKMGYQMSYPEEEIRAMTAKDCMERTKEGLYALFILNEQAGHEQEDEEITGGTSGRIITHGLADDTFIRGKVPMTKEEVRTISISKLKLQKDSVVYDIGCGTGSVAVEIARLSPEMEVYGIERKEEALELIRENRDAFGLKNLQVVAGLAPEALEDLPTPTHAFIGGSGGHLKDILTLLFDKNPEIRVVANAVSFETLKEFLEIEECFQVEDFDILQLSATRTRLLGSYHMMQGENPVWICSFKGKIKEEK